MITNKNTQKLKGFSSQIKSRKIVSSITEIDQEKWCQVAGNKNIYLTFNYLKALEDSMKEEMNFYYSISFNQKDEPVMVSAFQVVTFADKKVQNPTNILSKMGNCKTGIFKFNVLVCGNVFSDGENGFSHSESLSKKDAIDEMVIVSKEVKKQTKTTKRKASLVLFKEFWAKKDSYGKLFKSRSFGEFRMDVNMILPIHKKWNSFEDYLFSLKTKYRTRAKSVYKKSKNIVVKNLSSKEILNYSSEIEVLFTNVADKSSFSFGRIKSLAFAKLKENLGENFLLRAAFLEDELVGFSTSLLNNGILEANYVGINYELNYEKAIYQRLLYDYIEQSIILNIKELHLGRTSELIKSSLGALPENMNLYAKHNNTIHNFMMKPIFHFISPSKFELRKPFKLEHTNN